MMKLIFGADKHQSLLQVDTIIFGGRDPGMPKVFKMSVQYL